MPPFALWLGHRPAGARDERIVANLDLAPTVYDAAGVAPACHVDGRSLLRARAGDQSCSSIGASASVRPPSWTASWSPSRQYIQYEDGTLKYYDDAWQRNGLFGNDIAGDEPADADELAAQLEPDGPCVGTACP